MCHTALFEGNGMKLFIKRSVKEYVIYAAVTVIGIILDQLTKLLAALYLKGGDAVTVIPGVVQLRYVENRGAAFGMLDNAPWIFNTVSIIAIAAMVAFLFSGHAESKLSGIALSMMISGGIGNMIDRIRFRYVVDMIYLDMFDFTGINTIFNGADSFVCIGAGLLILALILEMKEEIKREKSKKEMTANVENEDKE